jgi:hypothetical protein
MPFKKGHHIGRPPGSQNKDPVEFRDFSRAACNDAIPAIVKLAEESQSEGIRLRAWGMLRDRGYGKPMQPSETKVEGTVELTIYFGFEIGEITRQ